MPLWICWLLLIIGQITISDAGVFVPYLLQEPDNLHVYAGQDAQRREPCTIPRHERLPTVEGPAPNPQQRPPINPLTHKPAQKHVVAVTEQRSPPQLFKRSLPGLFFWGRGYLPFTSRARASSSSCTVVSPVTSGWKEIPIRLPERTPTIFPS